MTGESAADAAQGRSLGLRDLADALDAVIRRVDDLAGEPLDRVTTATLEVIPGAEAVSLTVLSRGSFDTRASTHDLALRADSLQYELGHGPCVDAVLEDTANLSGDVATDLAGSPLESPLGRAVGGRAVRSSGPAHDPPAAAHDPSAAGHEPSSG